MAVAVDAGHLLVDGVLTETTAQLVNGFTSPSTNRRIDRIVLDRSGIAIRVTGIEAAAPTAPPLPANALPVAQVTLLPGVTTITNDMIVDERSVPFSAASGEGLLNVRTFTASGTYIPTPGTRSVIVELVGGGGSGGGCAATSGSQAAAAGGGGAGGYAKGRFTSGFAGAAIVVNAGGAKSASGFNAGNAGTSSSFGSLISAPGGQPGTGGPALAPPDGTRRSGPSAFGVGGNILNAQGAAGDGGFTLSLTEVSGGSGGSSRFGAGANAGYNADGISSTGAGAGGGGASSVGGAAARTGGAGGPGFVTVHEFG
jgi:hypothetical protein